MKYTGTTAKRTQVQRMAALRHIVRTAAKIESTDDMNRLLLITRQIQHRDSGIASQAEQLRDMINVWTVYHDDIEELSGNGYGLNDILALHERLYGVLLQAVS